MNSFGPTLRALRLGYRPSVVWPGAMIRMRIDPEGGFRVGIIPAGFFLKGKHAKPVEWSDIAGHEENLVKASPVLSKMTGRDIVAPVSFHLNEDGESYSEVAA